MEYSPLPFLCIGLVAAVGAAGLFALGRSEIKKLTERAGQLQRRGATESEIRDYLATDGYDPDLSAKVAAKVIRLAELERVNTLLASRGSEEEAQEMLVAGGMDRDEATNLVEEVLLLRWCRRWRVFLVPVGLLLLTSGVAVCGWGLVLGEAPGLAAVVKKEVVAAAGAGIICLGLLLLAGSFRKSP